MKQGYYHKRKIKHQDTTTHMYSILSFVFLVSSSFALEARIPKLGELPPNQKSKDLAYINELVKKNNVLLTTKPVTDPNLPLDVNLRLTIESIDNLSEIDMEMTITFIMQQFWQDKRLARPGGKRIVVPKTIRNKIWKPDVSIKGAKHASMHSVVVDNQRMEIGPGGEIEYKVKMSTTLVCKMALASFPMDRQTCTLSMYSFGYYADEIWLYWDNFPNIVYSSSIETLASFYLEEYISMVKNMPYCSMNGTLCRSKNILMMEFEFKRYFLSMFFVSYLPATVMVLLGGLSTYIDAKSSPARVGMGITTVLTISTVITGIKAQLPAVSYLTALDIYLWACFFFVSITLVEYAFLNYYTIVIPRSKSDSKYKLSKFARRFTEVNVTGNSQKISQVGTLPFDKRDDIVENGIQYRENTSMSDVSSTTTCFGKPLNSLVIDKYFRVVYASMFLLFNLIYWPYYKRLSNLHEDEMKTG